MFEILVLLVGVVILWRTYTMNEKLQASVDALVAEVAESNGKLASIRTFIEGVPALVGTAVEEALASANVDEEAAADLIDSARTSVSDNVDAALAAIDANPTPAEEGGPTVVEPPAEG